MSARECSAGIRLVSIVVIFVPCFVHTMRLLGRGDGVSRTLCLVVPANANAVVDTIAEIATSLSGCVTTDERDRAFDALSPRVALGTVAPGPMMPSADASRLALPTFAAASRCVFFGFAASEALRHARQPVFHRRAASLLAR